jgi:hypothetical protein
MDSGILAVTAANTLVAAAVTDAWEAARRGFSRLFGHGDLKDSEAAERRLAATHDELIGTAGIELEHVQARLAAQWATRLTDLLDEAPDAEADMRALIAEIQALLPAAAAAHDHAVAAGRDISIEASRGGVAAGVIHGNVSPPGPTMPGPASA